MKNEVEIAIFCKNIKALRLEKKLSKRKMAQMLKISTKTLVSLENGIMPPRLKTNVIILINKEFGILPSEMFEMRTQENCKAGG